MNFFDVTTFAVGVSSLTCLAAKAVCLIWAFVSTQVLAALFYLVFLIVNGLLPVVLAYTVSPEDYAKVWLLVGVGGAVIETGLFLWLVRSLLNHAPNIDSVSTDTDSASTEPIASD